MTDGLILAGLILLLAGVSVSAWECRKLEQRLTVLLNAIPELPRELARPAPTLASLSEAPVRPRFHDETAWQVLELVTEPAPEPESGKTSGRRFILKEWVREGTPAWTRAYETAGLYLKRFSPFGVETEIIEGLQ